MKRMACAEYLNLPHGPFFDLCIKYSFKAQFNVENYHLFRH